MLVAAHRASPEKVGEWQRNIAPGRLVVVYCARGHDVSQQAAAALRGGGLNARYLEGGITGWAELGLPLARSWTYPPTVGSRASGPKSTGSLVLG